MSNLVNFELELCKFLFLQESKPSLERIDAHLRHLVEANKNELREIKAVIQKGLINEVKLARNEIKDLRVVFHEILSEFKKLNRNKNGVPLMKRDSELLDYVQGDNSENIPQMSHQYPNYQRQVLMAKIHRHVLINCANIIISDVIKYISLFSYPNYHHIQTCQANSSVNFGTPVIPSVSNVLQPGNIPTSIMPNTFFSPQRPIAATDPLLFYHGLSYYAHGGPLSFADNQNLSYRTAAAQKPSFVPGSSAGGI